MWISVILITYEWFTYNHLWIMLVIPEYHIEINSNNNSGVS